jgi:uncharacterized protein (DUF2141 family)
MIAKRAGRTSPTIAVWALLVSFALIGDAAGAPGCASLCVKVTNLRTNRGKIICTIFNRPEAFPGDDRKSLQTVSARVANGVGTCQFAHVPAGTYAVVAFHDENSDGEFNRNWLGLPKEGYGFSDDAPARFSPPSFESAKFRYPGGVLEIVVHLRYGISSRPALPGQSKSIGVGLSRFFAYNSGRRGSPFSHTSSIERLGENP